MRLLQEMLEMMRTDGYVVTLPAGEERMSALLDSLDSRIAGKAQWIEELPSEAEWNLFQKVEPFVFSPEPALDHTYDASIAAKSWTRGFDPNEAIDAPFPVFSIEYLNGEPLDFFVMENGERRETIAILVLEIMPKQYGYYALCQDPGHARRRWKVFKSNMEGKTVEAILNRLRKEKIGVETARATVKIGNGKAKRIHRIRRIVHVSPKSLHHKYVEAGMTINWSHRWEVRGHWRVCEGLGKDRDGAYCVSGFTWVVNHEKGPEHLPLVKKTRVVIDDAG